MFNEQLAKIEKAKADIAAAEAKLAADRVAALSRLPTEYGFSDLNAFLKAVKEAYGKGGKASKSKPGRKPKTAVDSAPAKKSKGTKGKRAKITDDVKGLVREMSLAGKTGQEIAKALGISAPSVQNIKKAFGMVKSRSGTPSAAAVEVAPAEAPVSVNV
jgi:hypothetical protein